ncbi:MAG: hypothetical protein ACJAVS_001856 [Paracoccaceae bacterium]
MQRRLESGSLVLPFAATCYDAEGYFLTWTTTPRPHRH